MSGEKHDKAVVGPSKLEAIFAITEQIQRNGTMYNELPAKVVNRQRDFSKLTAPKKPLNEIPPERGNPNSRTYGL